MILPDNFDEILDGKVQRKSYQFDATWKEAAWFVVKGFLHRFDWSKWAFSRETNAYAILPAHTNQSFLSVIGKNKPVETPLGLIEPVRDQVRGFTRAMFDAHLEGHERYYFRSKDYADVREGYQSYDAGYKKLPFDAKLLGIDGKVREWKHNKRVIAVLDIDDKSKLGIAQPVRDWLINNFFPGSYCETSTNGHGVHLFLTFVMSKGTKIYQVKRWMDRFINFLAYQLAQWIETEPGMLALVSSNYSLLASHFHTPDLSSLIKSIAYSTLDRIAGLPTSFDGANRIKRGVCIRLPMFPNRMDSVVAFQMQPVILFEAWTVQMNGLMQAVSPLAVNGREYYMSNRASPTPSGRMIGLDYEEIDDDSVAIEDVYERTFHFLLGLCRAERRIVSIEEGVLAYEESGIPRDFSDEERKARHYRVSQALRQIAKTFDLEKIKGKRFDYSLVQDLHTELIQRVFSKEHNLLYQDGKRMRKVKVKELALIYTALEKNLEQGYKSGLSVDMVNRLLTENGCCKGMKVAQAVRAKLIASGLLRKVASAIKGVRGDCFIVGEPYAEVMIIRSLREIEAKAEEIVGRE